MKAQKHGKENQKPPSIETLDLRLTDKELSNSIDVPDLFHEHCFDNADRHSQVQTGRLQTRFLTVLAQIFSPSERTKKIASNNRTHEKERIQLTASKSKRNGRGFPSHQEFGFIPEWTTGKRTDKTTFFFLSLSCHSLYFQDCLAMK